MRSRSRHVTTSRGEIADRFRVIYQSLFTELSEPDRRDVTAKCESLINSNRITEQNLRDVSAIFQILAKKGS